MTPEISTDLKLVRMLLLGYEVTEVSPFHFRCKCTDGIGIAEERVWNLFFNNIKYWFGETFSEVYHEVNFNHKDFHIYLKPLSGKIEASYDAPKGKIKMTGLFNGFMDALNHDSVKSKELCENVGYWIQNSEEFAAYIAGRSKGIEREKEILNKYILDVASLQGGISLALDELDETHNGNLCNLLKGLLEIKPSLLNSDMQPNGASQEKPNSSTDDGNQITNP